MPETSSAAGAPLASGLAPAPAGVARGWLLALLPLVLLSGLLAVIVVSGPADLVRGDNFPPVERLAFQRVTLEPGFIVVSMLNDGPDAVTIAQVQVDEAFWTFSADTGTVLRHLGTTTLRHYAAWVGAADAAAASTIGGRMPSIHSHRSG